MHKIKKIVDLSWEFTADTPIYPGDPEPSVTVATTLENEGYNLSTLVMGTQTGSHVDAPYHFSNEGATIDQMELDFFLGDAIVVRVTDKKAEEAITMEDIEPYKEQITPGKIVDMGIKDANNMCAAMAPAFNDTLIAHFLDTGRNPSYYDAIISGDLGHIGKEIAIDLAKSQGYNIKSNYNDCGVLIFDKNAQDTHSGGSGCACCGTVFSGYFFKQLKDRKIKKLLLIATGALTNSTSSQQGESIPGIAHAISIEI